MMDYKKLTVNQNNKKDKNTNLNKNTYFIALFLITLASFGNNYSFNNPQALHEPLK
jgi:hypothetical protein